MLLVRPNLTETERSLLVSLLSARIEPLTHQSPDFKELYLLLLKLESAKTISTTKRTET